MAEAAFDGPQEAADFFICGWDLDSYELVVFLYGAVGLALAVVVDVAGDPLGELVPDVAQLVVSAVHLIGFVAVRALAGVHLEVVCSPALGCVHGT